MYVSWIAAALMAYLQQLAGFLCGLEHFPGAFKGVGHLFFAIDVQPGLHTRHRMRRMPEVGCGNYHRVKVLLLVEHFFVINIGIDLVAVSLEQA